MLVGVPVRVAVTVSVDVTVGEIVTVGVVSPGFKNSAIPPRQ